MEEAPRVTFDRERHVAFLYLMLDKLPEDYAGQEINRLTLAYFAVSSLSLLRALDRLNKDQIASWVLSFQAKPKEMKSLDDGQFYGFCGSRSSQFSSNGTEKTCHSISNLASTYSALAILKIVGYNLENIDSKSIILASMKNLQMPDGSFMPVHFGGETDLRFIYCAAAICFMLNDWSGMDREKARDYIINCQLYDGGFGLVPGSESHGGATYCAIASLHLMGFRTTSQIDLSSLVEWCLQRQGAGGGFQGRANKDSDTCYAFWVGGVLKILGSYQLLDSGALRTFLFSCQSPLGGFTKFPNKIYPDLYHSYYGFAALSLLEESGLNLNPLCVELGIPVSD